MTRYLYGGASLSMCERYSFALPKDKTARRFGVKVMQPLEAQYNISPGMRVPIVQDVSPQRLTMAKWGVTGAKSKLGKIGKPISSLSLCKEADLAILSSSRHCLMPADGFYIWRKVSKRSLVPFRVTLKWNLPFAFAGVWQAHTETDGAESVECALLTTKSNPLLSAFGAFMPVLLPLEEEKNWLISEGDCIEWLRNLQPLPPDRMNLFSVTPLLNRKELNSPALIEPVQAADQFGNYLLFD